MAEKLIWGEREFREDHALLGAGRNGHCGTVDVE